MIDVVIKIAEALRDNDDGPAQSIGREHVEYNYQEVILFLILHLCFVLDAEKGTTVLKSFPFHHAPLKKCQTFCSCIRAKTYTCVLPYYCFTVHQLYVAVLEQPRFSRRKNIRPFIERAMTLPNYPRF